MQREMLRYNKSLYRIVKDIHASFSATSQADAQGGCVFSKCYLMACLAQMLELKHYAEVGNYQGKRLFSVAAPFVLAGGTAVGVDSSTMDDASEKKNEFGYGESLQVIHDLPPDSALIALRERGYVIDMLHIGANRDAELLQQYYDSYCPLLATGAIIVFDGIGTLGADKVYQKAKAENLAVFESRDAKDGYEAQKNGDTHFGILQKADKTPENEVKARNLGIQLAAIQRKIDNSDGRPVVTVGVLAYEHGEFIAECLEHIFDQCGNFSMKLRVCEDCSSDNTVEEVERMFSGIDPSALIDAELIQNETNLGMVQNFKKLVFMMGEGDYFTLIDGDDYYSSMHRISTHIDYLEKHKKLAFSFNALTILDQKSGEFQKRDNQHLGNKGKKKESKRYTASDLAKINIVGNLGAGFYRTKFLKDLNPNLFEYIFCGDWMFNIAYYGVGKFGYIDRHMSVYRKHDGGAWSHKDETVGSLEKISCIDGYNLHTDYRFDDVLHVYRERLIRNLATYDSCCQVNSPDIVIFDDVFPNPMSGFRLQEYSSIMETFDAQVISIAEECLWLFGKGSIKREDFVREFKRANPNIARKLRVVPSMGSEKERYAAACEILGKMNAKLFYTIFLNNIYTTLDSIEKAQIPFIFTLYPGGGFAVNNTHSDNVLRRVLSSDYFYKVIVTQQNTYDYLIEKNFCKKEQIVFIFGGFALLEYLNRNVSRRFYGDGKDTIDICFVANKYTEYGKGKGYDIFVDAAGALLGMHDNIRFHVVGGFDADVLDVTDIGERITFYGTKPPDWFNSFHEGMDIILSPNLPYVLADGSFDGFPLSCVLNAGLSKVAMFCTDELGLNQGRFREGVEIVIVRPNVDHIVSCVDYYIRNPELLKNLAEAGYRRANELFSCEAQIAPRLELFSQFLENGHTVRDAHGVGFRAFRWVFRNFAPPFMQNIFWRARVKRQARATARKEAKAQGRKEQMLIYRAYNACVPLIAKKLWRRIKRQGKQGEMHKKGLAQSETKQKGTFD